MSQIQLAKPIILGIDLLNTTIGSLDALHHICYGYSGKHKTDVSWAVVHPKYL